MMTSLNAPAFSTLLELLQFRASDAAGMANNTAFTYLEDGERISGSITFWELDREARHIAAHLQTLTQAGDRVLVVYPPSLEYIVAFFACVYAGVIAVPALPPANARTLPRLQLIANDAQPRIALAPGAIVDRMEKLQAGASDPLSGLSWLAADRLPDAATHWVPPQLSPSDIAFLQYTSGSTGNPKGVMVSHANILANTALIHARFGIQASEVVVSWLPPHHDMGLIGKILYPVYAGCHCVQFPPAAFLMRPYRWLKALSDYRARITGAPNFAYELCISKISEEQKQTLDLSALEFALNGAEPIRHGTLQRFAQAFAPCGLRPETLTPVYGLAESTLLVSASTNKVKGELPNHQAIGKAGLARDEIKITTDTSDMTDIVSVGATGSSGHHAIIVDPSTHAVLTDNTVGEIWLCGPSVAHGYWNRPEESRQTFAATVADRNAAYLRTGDLGFVHRNELYITGRIKEMMVFNGRNIYPQDVEATVERIDPAFRVNGCAVFSLEEGATAQLVIIQEIESRKEPLVAELLNKLRADLAEQHEIFAIEAILLVKAGHIPRTSSGKIQRRRCKELFLSNAFSSIWAWRNTPPPAPSEEQPPKTAYQKYKERQKKSFPSYKKPVADYIPPQTETEQRLARIWGEFLGIEKISSTDNFFTMLGGHSLSATQVISKLRDEFGVELELRTIYDAPTLASLAQQIDLAQQQQAGSIIPAITPIERHGPLQLSFAQQRLWFLDQLESGSAFYNIPAAVRLTGQLDIAAFTHTLNEIVRRHEVLRTTFTSVDGTPVQLIAPAVELALPITDLGNLPHSERETQAQCLVQKEAQTPFDLATGPLIRAGLLRLAPNEHILVLTVHHIVSDGWSMGILVHEIATLYAAYVQGLPSPLPALTIQYADFAHWQRQWLTGDVLQRQLSYWTTQLAGAPALLALPTDHPRPPVQRYRGATLSFTVPQTTLTGLHALCKQAQATLFMTLTAAFNVLLSRYSGQNDICIGTAIANRNRAEIEPLIGFFVNTLVLRTQVDRNATFYALLQQMRITALGAYAHQDVPFEQLVDAIKPERDASHAPLFQVMLILQNAPMEKLTLPSLTLQSMSVDNATAKFDLKLSLTEDADQLYGSFEYNTDLFNASTVQRMAGHFVRLLEAVAADSACRIDALPMQSSDERQHVLQQWNQAQPSFLDIEDSDLRMPLATPNLITLFDQAVLSYRSKTAIAWGTETLDYGVLDARSNQIANGLIAHGATKGTIVAILLDEPVAQIVATLGVLKAGCVFASLNTTYPTQRLRDMCALVAPRWLISEAACIQQVTALLDVPEGERQLMLMDPAEVSTPSFAPNQVPAHHITQQASTRPAIPTMPDDPCYIYFTSGSTGIPKAVLGRTAGLAHFIQWEIEAFGLDAQSRVSQLTPPTFDVYLRDIFAALCAGGTVCIPPSREVLEPVALADWIEQSGVTLVHCVPSVFRLLLEGNLSAERFASLRHILLAGEALLPADANRWIRLFGERSRLVNLYGPTETTLAKFYYRVPSTPIAESFIPVGKPIPGAQAILLKENLEPCADGEVGEIHIRTPYRSLGYYNRPDLNRAAFIRNPFTKGAHDLLYRTGDLALLQPNGDFRFMGRKDAQVKIRGMRIEPGEIETALAALPGVRNAVVLAREDSAGDRRLAAYVVPHRNTAETALDAALLRKALSQMLPDYMVPAHFVLLDRLPLTPNGKVDRKALPAPDIVGSDIDHVAPRTPMEDVLASIWGEVLHFDKVGIRHNFFHIGGHSLLATQLISRVRSAFQIELPLHALFEAPTIESLSDRIKLAQQKQSGLTAPDILPVEHGDTPPLSFAQQRLWFLDQFESGSAFYNIPVAMRLVGELDVAALARTLNEIVRRHEALRTTFSSADGNPVQVLASALEIVLPVMDLTALAHAEREANAQWHLQDEAQTPFDLTTGPLIRARLIRLEQTDHIIALTLHHIVADAWSMGVLVREVAALYAAYRGNLPSPLPELAIQYADFAHWQRQWLSGDVLQRQLSYWTKQLADAPALLALPTDRPRPPVQRHHGAATPFTVSAKATAGLYALGRQAGATLFMTLTAAFNVLLSRYSGQTDICIGTPVANRNRSEIEALIGFFVNTLVLRSHVDSHADFNSLLQQVRATGLGAYAHQDVPFEQLVDAIKPERHLSHSPLFQVMLVLQNAPISSLTLSDLSLQPITGNRTSAKFDLTLYVTENDGQLSCSFEYDTDLFDSATIARMGEHFTRLLDAIIAAPGARIGDLSLLGEDERRQLLVDWNQTAVPYPQTQTLCQLLEAQVMRSPERVALVFGETTLTYRALNAQANQVAHHLHSLGVGPDTLVGICVERSLDMVVGLLAILKAGGAYVPLDPTYPAERLAYMLDDAQPAVLLTQQHVWAHLPATGMTVFCLDAQAPSLAAYRPANLASTALLHHLAYVIYTSGSTGKPKGVGVTQGGMLNLMHAIQQAPGMGSDDVLLSVTSLSFDIAALELLLPLLCGARTVLASREAAANPAQLAEIVSRRQVSVMQATPSTWRMLVEHGWPQSAQPLKVMCGGEALPVPLAREILQHTPALWNMYGPTETTIYSILGCVASAEAAPAIGRPIANTCVYILDAALEPVPVGVAGELHIAGAGLARGYLHRPDLTADKFIPDPFGGEPGARMYKSGDLARYLPDGRIEYLGRIDHQVKVRGFRIELGEIEAALTALPGVRESVVLAREDAPGDKRLTAYLVAQKEEAPDAMELRGMLLQSLPEYMVPAHFVVLDRLPLTPNGKLDRKALPAPDTARSDNDHVAPRTPDEELLAAIWSDVLKLEKVGVHDNFFHLGGDSILSIQIIARARKNGLYLTPKDLFQHPTIASLSMMNQATPAIQAEQGLVAGEVALTPIQHWFFEQRQEAAHHHNQALMLQVLKPLEPELLAQALEALVRHHDALRLRFTAQDGVWRQSHAEAVTQPDGLTTIDLRHLSASEQATAIACHADQLQASFNLTDGPLMRLVYFVLGEQPGRLLLSCHHLVIDGVSWRIFLEDLHTAYTQLAQGNAIALPPKTSSFKQWSEHLSAYANTAQLLEEHAFWKQVGAVAPIPVDFPEGANTTAVAATVTTYLDVEATEALLTSVPVAYRTRINDVLLTALSFAVADWTHGHTVLIDLEGHGREDLFEEVDITRTIGWFTSLFPVQLHLGQTHDYGVALKTIKEQLRAIPHHGIGYGILRYLSGDAALSPPNPVCAAAICFNYLGQFDQVLENSALFAPASESHGLLHGPQNARSHEIEINAMIREGQLQLSWTYSAHRFNAATIETLATGYLRHLGALIQHCAATPEGAGGYTPSDFSLVDLDQQALDALLDDLSS